MINAAQQVPVPASRRLWRNRNFNIFWLGQTLSSLGDAFSLIGLPLVVFQATNSISQMGLVAALVGLGNILSGLVAGVIADRLNRRFLLIFCDMGRLLAYASLPLVWWLNGPQIWLLYLVAFVGGVLATCFEVTYSASLPNLVDIDQVGEANGRMQYSAGLTFMIGPALAGVISNQFGPVMAIGIDSSTFAISVLTLFLIRFRAVSGGSVAVAEEYAEKGFFDRWVTGAHFLFQNRLLRNITLVLMVYFFITAASLNLFLFYLKSNLGESDNVVGLIFGLASAGAIPAGLFVPGLLRRLGFGICFVVSMAICSISIGSIGLASSFLMVLPLTMVFTFSDTARNICSGTTRQQVTPNYLLGRTTSVFRVVTLIPYAIGLLVGSFLADKWGASTTLLVIGGLSLIVALAALLTPVNVRRPIPATETEANQPLLTRKQRKRWQRRILTGLVSFIILLLLAISGGIYWLMIRPLPQTDGTVEIPGLQAPVSIVRDKAGVPHIKASNTNDLFIAQGYVAAQDRLWQMDFNRHIGEGRLSEILGDATITQDRYLRTMGLEQAAQRELDISSPETNAILDSYAKGVNAFINTHRDNLPIEFSLLGYQPDPWKSRDSVLWGRVMDYNLAGNYDRELLRASLIEKFGSDKAFKMLPLTSNDGTLPIIPNGVSYDGISKDLALDDIQSQIVAYTAGDVGSKGSNNWVVGGAKTTTGKPMLANDPHLGLSNPSIWYEVQLTAPGWNVTGVSFPGVPGVIAGHNDRIAWGVTNAEADTQDLYLEKINPDNPNQYEYQGKWVDMTVHTEEIKIKNRQTQTITIRSTRHGPLLNGVDDYVAEGTPTALKWVALGDAKIFEGVLGYDRASNWQEFRNALRNFNIAAQNFVYADVDGNIGYQMPGFWPLRAKGDGLLPVPGWTGEYEWTGYANFDDLPSVYNPPQNFIATANNLPQVNSKVLLGKEFHPDWRAARITELLKAKEKLSLEDLGKIQFDLKTEPGQEMASYMANVPNPNAKIAPAVSQLKSWDGVLSPDSVPASIYKVAYQYALTDMYQDKIGDQMFHLYLGEYRFSAPYFMTLLKDPQNEWWGEGGRDALLTKALGQAVDYLSSRLGNSPDNWKWGKIHSITFVETPLGDALPLPLQWIMNLKTIETGGDPFTVNAGTYSSSKPYNQLGGPSFRGLYNLSDFDQSLMVNSGGASGQPFSKYYGYDLENWATGHYHPDPFSDNAIQDHKDATLTLKPAP